MQVFFQNSVAETAKLYNGETDLESEGSLQSRLRYLRSLRTTARVRGGCVIECFGYLGSILSNFL